MIIKAEIQRLISPIHMRKSERIIDVEVEIKSSIPFFADGMCHAQTAGFGIIDEDALTHRSIADDMIETETIFMHEIYQLSALLRFA